MPILTVSVPEDSIVVCGNKTSTRAFFLHYMQLQLNKASPLNEYWELAYVTVTGSDPKERVLRYNVAYRVIKLKPVKWNAKPQAKTWALQNNLPSWYVPKLVGHKLRSV